MVHQKLPIHMQKGTLMLLLFGLLLIGIILLFIGISQPLFGVDASEEAARIRKDLQGNIQNVENEILELEQLVIVDDQQS